MEHAIATTKRINDYFQAWSASVFELDLDTRTQTWATDIFFHLVKSATNIDHMPPSVLQRESAIQDLFRTGDFFVELLKDLAGKTLENMKAEQVDTVKEFSEYEWKNNTNQTGSITYQGLSLIVSFLKQVMDKRRPRPGLRDPEVWIIIHIQLIDAFLEILREDKRLTTGTLRTEKPVESEKE